MDIKPIKTEADYEAALDEVEHLFGSTPDTPEGDRLEVSTTLIEAYEEKHYSIPSPDPIETILYVSKAGGSLIATLSPTLAAVLKSLRY